MIVIDVAPWEAAVGLGLGAVFTGIWASSLRAGVRVRYVVALISSAICLGLFFLVESGTELGVFQTAPLDLAVLLLVGAAGAVYSYDVAETFRFPDGGTGYRTRGVIPILWFLVLVLAVGAEVVFLGQVTLVGAVLVQGIPNPATPLGITVPEPGWSVLTLTDFLFAVSTGLVLGQTGGIHARLLQSRWMRGVAVPPARAGRRRADS